MKTGILSLAAFGFVLQFSAVAAQTQDETWDFFAVEREGYCRSYGTTGLYRKYRVSFDECKRKCSRISETKYCTAIEYHEDTRRCEVHYWDITSVKSLAGKSRHGKVKCIEVCKGTDCFPDNNCYTKIGDGACYGAGNGRESYQRDVNRCYKKCRATKGCDAYEYNEGRRVCRTFQRVPSQAVRENGKICFKWHCFDRDERLLTPQVEDSDEEEGLVAEAESAGEVKQLNAEVDSKVESNAESNLRTTKG